MGEFWHHYAELMADPAHMAVEFTFVLIDVLIIQAAVAWLKRHFHRDLRREHMRLDAEHGVTHAVDPMDPRGDGTLRSGDPAFEIFEMAMRTGQPVVGEIHPDGSITARPVENP